MALWTPTDLDTLELWLDAQDVQTLTLKDGSTDAIKTWQDKSGYERNFTCPTDNDYNMPKTGQNTINGNNVLYFQGAPYPTTLVRPTIHSGTDARAIFIVFRATSLSPNASYYRTMFNLSDYWTEGLWQVSMSVDKFVFGTYINSTYSTFPGGYVNQKPYILNVAHDANVLTTEISCFFTGRQGSTYWSEDTTTEELINVLPQNSTIGDGKRYEDEWIGDIGEIIFLSENPNDLTRLKIEGYLAHKWGMTADLEDQHPFKLNPPQDTDTALTTVSGIILGSNGLPAAREIRAYLRSSGLFITSTTSDPTTGFYSLALPTVSEIQRVVLADEPTLYNDIIDRIIPG
jgi:hypothetical protein